MKTILKVVKPKSNNKLEVGKLSEHASGMNNFWIKGRRKLPNFLEPQIIFQIKSYSRW
jgi:hypothetical protein